VHVPLLPPTEFLPVGPAGGNFRFPRTPGCLLWHIRAVATPLGSGVLANLELRERLEVLFPYTLSPLLPSLPIEVAPLKSS